MKKNDLIWKRMGHGPIKEPILDYLSKMFDEEIEKGMTLKVAVGTDSQRKGKGYNFATVIDVTKTEDLGGGVVVGRGTMVMYISHFTDKYKKTKAGVKERMLYEVSKSIEIAYEISPLLDLYEIPLEVHADINPDIKWESNKAISESVGYILGMGYEFKIKPDAWAASKSADKASRS